MANIQAITPSSQIQNQPARLTKQKEILALVCRIAAAFVRMMNTYGLTAEEGRRLWKSAMDSKHTWTNRQGAALVCAGVATILSGAFGVKFEPLKVVSQATPMLGNAASTVIGGYSEQRGALAQDAQQNMLGRAQESRQSIASAEQTLMNLLASFQEKAPAGG